MALRSEKEIRKLKDAFYKKIMFEAMDVGVSKFLRDKEGYNVGDKIAVTVSFDITVDEPLDAAITDLLDKNGHLLTVREFIKEAQEVIGEKMINTFKGDSDE